MLVALRDDVRHVDQAGQRLLTITNIMALAACSHAEDHNKIGRGNFALFANVLDCCRDQAFPRKNGDFVVFVATIVLVIGIFANAVAAPSIGIPMLIATAVLTVKERRS